MSVCLFVCLLEILRKTTNGILYTVSGKKCHLGLIFCHNFAKS